jgi:CelD/BcsL family acetyltransferase involved in cellulose biosynthesis
MDAAARSSCSTDLWQLGEDGASDAASRTVATPIELQLITDRAAFDALEAEWNELFARTANPTHVFQTFNFCWHWANHYLVRSSEGPALKLSIVTGRRDGRLVMVWPLVSERVRGITQTFWMGTPVAQYGDVLIESGAEALTHMRAALDFLRAQTKSDLLRLRHVRADSNVARLMLAIGADVADRQLAPYMDLRSAGDFAQFEQRYSAKTRKNRRRLARRLAEKGPVEFVRVRGGQEARALAIEAVKLKACWLKERGLLSNAIADERTANLFADLAEGGVKPAGCVVSGLKSDGETAALELSFTCKGHLAMHLIAFNLAYEKSGAGVLLLEQSLRNGYDEGLDVYDMLAPADPYKFDWCDQSHETIDWVKPLSLKGYLYARLYLDFLRAHVKAMLKAAPQSLRRLVRAGYLRGASRG